MKDVKQAAEDFAHKANTVDLALDPEHFVFRAFVAGHEWTIENCSEGFDEWLNDPKTSNYGNRASWTAAKLSSAKEIAEKDAEIEKLQADKAKLVEALKWYADRSKWTQIDEKGFYHPEGEAIFYIRRGEWLLQMDCGDRARQVLTGLVK